MKVRLTQAMELRSVVLQDDLNSDLTEIMKEVIISFGILSRGILCKGFLGKSEACFCLEGFKINEMGPPYDLLVPVPSSPLWC